MADFAMSAAVIASRSNSGKQSVKPERHPSVHRTSNHTASIPKPPAATRNESLASQKAALLAHHAGAQAQENHAPSAQLDSASRRARQAQGRVLARQHSENQPSRIISIAPEYLTDRPPVRLEREEAAHNAALHASAVTLAREVYARRAPNPTDTGQVDSEEDANDLHNTAQQQVASRLAKLHDPTEKANFQNYYGKPTPPRPGGTPTTPVRSKTQRVLRKSPRSNHPAVPRRYSTGVTQSENSDDYQSAQSRSQMSMQETKLDHVDSTKQQSGDPVNLLEVARQRVQERMNQMDENVFGKTGKMSPAMALEWEEQARAKRLARGDYPLSNELSRRVSSSSGPRSEKENKRDEKVRKEKDIKRAVDVGGVLVDSADIEKLAISRVKPTLEDIDKVVQLKKQAECEEEERENERKKTVWAEKQRRKKEKEEEKEIRATEQRRLQSIKEAEQQKKKAQKEAEQEKRRAEKEAEQQKKRAEKEAEQEKRRIEKDAEQQRIKAIKEAEHQRKLEENQAEMIRKQKEKDAKEKKRKEEKEAEERRKRQAREAEEKRKQEKAAEEIRLAEYRKAEKQRLKEEREAEELRKKEAREAEERRKREEKEIEEQRKSELLAAEAKARAARETEERKVKEKKALEEHMRLERLLEDQRQIEKQKRMDQLSRLNEQCKAKRPEVNAVSQRKERGQEKGIQEQNVELLAQADLAKKKRKEEHDQRQKTLEIEQTIREDEELHKPNRKPFQKLKSAVFGFTNRRRSQVIDENEEEKPQEQQEQEYSPDAGSADLRPPLAKAQSYQSAQSHYEDCLEEPEYIINVDIPEVRIQTPSPVGTRNGSNAFLKLTDEIVLDAEDGREKGADKLAGAHLRTKFHEEL